MLESVITKIRMYGVYWSVRGNKLSYGFGFYEQNVLSALYNNESTAVTILVFGKSEGKYHTLCIVGGCVLPKHTPLNWHAEMQNSLIK